MGITMKENNIYSAPELYVIGLSLDSSILTSSSTSVETDFESDWTVSNGGTLGL